MHEFRSFLYRLARFLGDWQALRRGRFHKRLPRRMVGRLIGRKLNRLFR